MIGAEANCSISYWDSKTKLDHYCCDNKFNQVSVASLKFKIMMQMCQDNYKFILNGVVDRIKCMEWNVEDLQLHQEKILKFIIK